MTISVHSSSESSAPRLRRMNLQDFNKALEKFRNMSIQVNGAGLMHDAIDG